MFNAILLLGCIVAFFAFPAFRKLVVIVAIVLALSIFAYVQNNKARIEASKKLVRLDQLEFIDMRLGQYSNGYKLTGRIKNNSQYTVTWLTAKIHISDCDIAGHCEIVGEEEQIIGSIVPSGQLRDIDQTVYFSAPLQIKGHFEWDYVVTEIKGSPKDGGGG